MNTTEGFLKHTLHRLYLHAEPNTPPHGSSKHTTIFISGTLKLPSQLSDWRNLFKLQINIINVNVFTFTITWSLASIFPLISEQMLGLSAAQLEFPAVYTTVNAT